MCKCGDVQICKLKTCYPDINLIPLINDIAIALPVVSPVTGEGYRHCKYAAAFIKADVHNRSYYTPCQRHRYSTACGVPLLQGKATVNANCSGFHKGSTLIETMTK